MATFTAPTYDARGGDEALGHGKDQSLWRWYEPMHTVIQTVIISGGTAVPLASEVPRALTADEIAGADSGSGENGKAVFRGQTSHTVTSGEGTILTAGGYTVT